MNLPHHMTKTYGIHVPKEAFRVATCQEVGCKAYQLGWSTMLLLGDNDEYDKMYKLIRDLKYSYTIEVLEDGFSRLTFPPGQVCFRGRAGGHRKRAEGFSELFYVKDNKTLQTRVHTDPNHWVEDSALHQDKLATAFNRG